jgi:peptide/nickel transport system ATP-binding protein/oligopeptide transport system ATP-binding protein
MYSREPLIILENLSVSFPLFHPLTRRCTGKKYALRNLSLKIFPNECLGIMGESGCGKSTLARAIGCQCDRVEGKITFAQDFKNRREFCRHIQLISQSPQQALDPTWTVEETLKEPLQIHFPSLSGEEQRRKIGELLRLVLLDGDSKLGHRKPQELSGGQRQRVAIARALAVNPHVLICDEIINSLDAPIQGEIIQLLKKIGREHSIALLFISHDPIAVASIAQRVALMDDGKILSLLSREEFVHHLNHSPCHGNTPSAK